MVSCLVKNAKNDVCFFFQQEGVEDRQKSGKNGPLSDFYLIVIMFLEVNNRHVSEGKCTYFMAGEKRKFVIHEIYEKYISLELLYRRKQSVKNVPVKNVP